MDDHVEYDIDLDEFVCGECVDDCFPPRPPNKMYNKPLPPNKMYNKGHIPNIPTNSIKKRTTRSWGGPSDCCFLDCIVGDDDDDASLEECVCGKVGHPLCLEVFLGHENVDNVFCCHECVKFDKDVTQLTNANLNKHDKKQQGKKSTLDDDGDTESVEDDKNSHLNWSDNNGPRNKRANNGGGYKGNITAAYDNRFNVQGGSSAEEDEGGITEINKEVAHLEEEEDEMAQMKSDRVDRLIGIFAGPSLSKKGINAADKRTYTKDLFGYVSIKFVLTGQRLTKGKATYEVMARMVNETGFSTKKILDFASPLLQIGKLIHEEHCQDDECNICNGGHYSDAGMVDLDQIEAARHVARLFELSYEMLLAKESSESDCARAAGPPKKKKVSKDLFKPDNCPPGLRSLPSMVSIYESMFYILLILLSLIVLLFFHKLIRRMIIGAPFVEREIIADQSEGSIRRHFWKSQGHMRNEIGRQDWQVKTESHLPKGKKYDWGRFQCRSIIVYVSRNKTAIACAVLVRSKILTGRNCRRSTKII